MLNDRVQNIAIDVGRGYLKYYSEYNGNIYKGMFKSIRGEYRPLNFNDYDDPICIEYEGESYFCGSLAEKESHQAVRNSGDSKTSLTVQILRLIWKMMKSYYYLFVVQLVLRRD